MVLFAQDPDRGDFYTIWGFWVGIVGFILTLLGLGIAIWQVKEAKRQAKQAKSAAEAAREAADRAYAESRRYFQKLVASDSHHLVTRLRKCVTKKSWKFATLRANELSDQMGLFPDNSPEMIQMIGDLREWAGRFARLASGELKQFQANKWNGFLRLLQQQIDGLRNPFSST
jgi:hypothetical protein